APLSADVRADDTSLASAFDKAWARSLLRDAARVMQSEARRLGDRALRRFELLEQRFQNGLTIREIAKLWNADPAVMHHEYATARREFRAALNSVVAFHQPQASASEVDKTCAELLAVLM